MSNFSELAMILNSNSADLIIDGADTLLRELSRVGIRIQERSPDAITCCRR